MNLKNELFPKPISEFDLRLLRIFKVVVECGGFTAAETVLNVTKSTISVHMGNLESRLGVKLAIRGRQGFSLTEQGRLVYDASLDLFASLNDFAHRMQDLESELSGELSIVCSDQVALSRQLKLPEVIARIAEQAPKVKLAVNSDTIPNTEQSILKGEAHIGIIPDYRSIDGLAYQPCYSETYYLCIGRKHPLFDRPDSRISDDEVQQAVTVHPGVDVNLSGIQQFQTLTLGARAYQFETRTPLILSGLYQGFFPLSYIQSYLDRGEVRLLQPNKRYYNVDHVLVYKDHAKPEPKVKLFLEAFDAVAGHSAA